MVKKYKEQEMIRRLNIRNIDITRCKVYDDISVVIENAIASALIKDNILEDSIVNIIERNRNDDCYDVAIYFRGD